jgi:hypothetical protein
MAALFASSAFLGSRAILISTGGRNYTRAGSRRLAIDGGASPLLGIGLVPCGALNEVA